MVDNEADRKPETKMASVAQTILEQLGGNKAVAMMGIKHAVTRANENGDECGIGLRFKAKALDGINHIEIGLDPLDLYTVGFWRITVSRTGTLTKQIDRVYEVPAENLRRVIEQRTGLALSL